MRVLITGADGRLGSALRDEPTGWDTVLSGRRGQHAADLADLAALDKMVESVAPDVVIHAAACTDVDHCEENPGYAERVNAQATGAVAAAASRVGARMVYVSTDYVFDGAAGPYREGAPTRPLSAYGRSKLAGEVLGQENLPSMVVARTSALFGGNRPDFVTWLANRLREGKQSPIIDPQWVSPTYVRDLARQLVAIVGAGIEAETFHTAGADQMSRVECARRVAEHVGASSDLIRPVTDLPWIAPRPQDSSLDVSKITRLRAPMHLEDALQEMGL